jgi:uncharacterized membrane protein YtjA (UPF0391 family)
MGRATTHRASQTSLMPLGACPVSGSQGFSAGWREHCVSKFVPQFWFPLRRNEMLGWPLMFLIVAIIAGVFGFSGIAGTATQIAWILFVVGLILALVFLLVGRRPPI